MNGLDQKDHLGPTTAAYLRGRRDAITILEEMIDGDHKDDAWITEAIEKINRMYIPEAVR